MDLTSKKSNDVDSVQETKPAHLCLRCGICCKVAVPSFSYEEIKKFAEENDKESIEFLSIFEPYKSIDDIPEEGRPHLEQIINTLSQNNENFDINEITVYKCRYIDENNTCPIYEKRPQCCRRAPHNGWSLFQPLCGYKGWQFKQREFIKQQVRSIKETLYEIEMIGKKDELYLGKTIDELNEYFEQKIAPWYKYGAKYW